MHTLKPLDVEAIVAAAQETAAIVTVEEHSIVGGLGGAVAEVLLEKYELHVKFKRLGLPDIFVSQVGSQEWLLAKYGLSPEGICKSVREFVQA